MDLPPLTPARLRWHDQTPESIDFGDIYFSRENGLEESRHVFLAGNRLAERFAALPGGSTFVIGETGFGTGLNFLLAYDLWQATAPPDAQLVYLSTERFPLTAADLSRALSGWPALSEAAAALQSVYPPLLPGFHWLPLPGSRVTLLLLFGDANQLLPQLADCDALPEPAAHPWHVDAWFLDGFAPTRNPELWQTDLLATLRLLSRPGTTLATFSAAGQLRRDLSSNGFTVAKCKGYGRKREMITATVPSEATRDPAAIPQPTSTPWLLPTAIPPRPDQVTIIGAGLAGCHLARTLANRGVTVTVLEQHDQPAREASGNPQGALYTRLSAEPAALARFGLASLLFALRHYRESGWQDSFHPSGLLQRGDNEGRKAALFQHAPGIAHYLDPAEAAARAGLPVTGGGWWMPLAGWVEPAALCRQLLQHPGITLRSNAAVTRLASRGGEWQLETRDGQSLRAAHVVLACANQASHLAGLDWLPLRPVRGQVSFVPATAESQRLRPVLCGDGYITPAQDGYHCLGASFVPGDESTQLRTDDHQHNLALLSGLSPALQAAWQDHLPTRGRAAIRSTTPDHLPLVGRVPDRDPFLARYNALRHNARRVIPSAAPYLPGLWLLAGFGGRGLCYIPLAAELLAAQLLHLPRPLPRDLQQALSPARFLLRELIRSNAQ